MLSPYFHCLASPPPRPLPSFPTRRSSDLPARPVAQLASITETSPRHQFRSHLVSTDRDFPPKGVNRRWDVSNRPRSEEHTSELQSPCNLVCRLLLEKKHLQHHSHNKYTHT